VISNKLLLSKGKSSRVSALKYLKGQTGGKCVLNVRKYWIFEEVVKCIDTVRKYVEHDISPP
jgi:hypothetical protein